MLAGLSEGNTGRRVVFVDLGLCAIFGGCSLISFSTNAFCLNIIQGGFTVLSTKAISTLLTLEWWDMFAEWITYPVILVS